jgi:hypothetical protein
MRAVCPKAVCLGMHTYTVLVCRVQREKGRATVDEKD